MVLISPLHAFSPGSAWWTALEAWFKVFSKEKAATGMDFIFPELTADFRGFIFRPASYDRALRILKHALFLIGVPSEIIELLTWHSLRVFFPELAFQSLVPKSLRSFLGNWAQEDNADVYTREKRAVVAKIHQQILDKYDSLTGLGPRQVRVDLDHEDWDDSRMESNHLMSSRVALKESPSKKVKLLEDSAQSILLDDDERPGMPVAPVDLVEDEDMVASLRSHPSPVCADLVVPPLGPLLVYYRVKRSSVLILGQKSQRHKIHLFTTKFGHLTEVGQGWEPDKGAIEPLSYLDFRGSEHSFSKCDKCFRKFSLPSDWQDEPAEDVPDDTASISSASEAPSADSASEDEAFKPPSLPM